MKNVFPSLPHQFFGSVKVNGAKVPEGTEVTAVINGVSYLTNVNATGYYGYHPTFKVPTEDIDPKHPEVVIMVEFFVYDKKAGEARLEVWGLTRLDLTMITSEHSLSVSAFGGGLVINPGIGVFLYDEGDVVALEAADVTGFSFINWTGPVESEYEPLTTVTVSGNVDVTANFGVKRTRLNIDSSAGGSVIVPGEGLFQQVEGTAVPLKAVPEDDFEFMGWSGDTDGIDNITNADANIIVLENSTIHANFVEVGGHTLEEIIADLTARADAGERFFYVPSPDGKGSLIKIY